MKILHDSELNSVVGGSTSIRIRLANGLLIVSKSIPMDLPPPALSTGVERPSGVKKTYIIF